MNLLRNSTQIQATPTSARLVTEFLPSNFQTTIDYECLPTYSSMQFAEIVDTNGVTVVQRFGIRSGR